jgi:hypothetical protein
MALKYVKYKLLFGTEYSVLHSLDADNVIK